MNIVEGSSSYGESSKSSSNTNRFLQVPGRPRTSLESKRRPRALSDVPPLRPSNLLRSRGLTVDDSRIEYLDNAQERSKSLSNLARQYALGVMAQHTFEEAVKQKLIMNAIEYGEPVSPTLDSPRNNLLQGVAFRASKGVYAHYPQERGKIEEWIGALTIFNVGAAITIATTVTRGIIDMIPDDVFEIAISHSNHVQVIKKIEDLVNARKAQGAAFILEEKCVLVWSDEPEQLLSDAQVTHQMLTTFLWHIAGASFCHENGVDAPNTRPVTSMFPVLGRAPPSDSYASTLRDPNSTPTSPNIQSQELKSMMPPPLKSRFSVFDGKGQLLVSKEEKIEVDEEADAFEGEYEERMTVPLSAFMHGCAFSMALVISVLQLRQAFIWCLLDGEWARMALIAVCPFFFILVMFFCDTIFTVICMLIGPIRQYSQNSRYYSGNKPRPLRQSGPLPHITIQMPVYKEDFEFVLKPSFESVKKAIRTYELQGGSASMVISEDGMVLLDEVEKQKRLDYYEENNMTWVGRPKHNKDGFVREGRFKKASNLNFTYDVLLKTEALLNQRKAMSPAGDANHKALYKSCLQEVLADIHPDACGNGIDFFGDYILMIDSDTRVPTDCFLDAATEMTRSKDVGILQHCSGVMLVSTSFFERCIAFFTRIVNFAISYAISCGDVAPFMGHNAYLRWSAMKEIGRTEMLPNGQTKLRIWSEDHVSEDFVMALEMLERGYIIRWATYSKGEYMEGVSLSCDDELNRWQKYAWGVSEMIFRPFNQWHKGGPLTPLIKRFLTGSAPVHYKWASMSYCFSYYAIMLSFPLTVTLTVLQGWLGRQVWAPFTTSFQILIVCLVIFSLAGSLSLCVARFRAGDASFFATLKEYAIHIPFLMVFFSGLSYHVCTALISHLLAIDMTWGATLKDIEMSNFFSELPQILKRHWKLFTLSSIIIAGLFLLSSNTVPSEWRIKGITVLFPAFYIYGMHILFPLALNPNMVRFSF